MSDLINRSALSEEIESLTMVVTGLRSGKSILGTFMKEYKKSVLKIIEEQPPVEAVPVVHGTWVNTDGYDEWECDNCGYLICGYDDEPSKGEMKFCNMCGADMRKKVKQNE